MNTENSPKVEARKQGFIKAADVIRRYLSKPNELFYRVAMQEGCLEEASILLHNMSEWLDDDLYYDELAWIMEEKEDL